MAGRFLARWRDEPSGWWRASVVFLGVALLLVVALAVTGIALSTSYRPDGTDGPGSTHRVLSTVLFWAGFGVLVSGLGLAVQRHQAGGERRSVLLTGGLPLFALVAVVLATLTGYLIAWDQLALSAVTVGSDLDGIWAASFDDGIRFVLVDGTEVSQSTFAREAIAHVVLVPVALLGLGLAIGRRLARRASSPDPREPEPAVEVPEPV